MKTIITEGMICIQDDYNFLYRICKIEYKEKEDGTFVYSFFPNYDVIDFIPNHLFGGIQGIDLTLKKEKYIRENIVPCFIEERSPSPNREDLQDLLISCNMKSLNRLEWLKRTNTRYSGDRQYVRSIEEIGEKKTITIESMFDLVEKPAFLTRKLLQIICLGDNLISKEITINEANRKYYYDLLMPMYIRNTVVRKELQMEGVEDAKIKNKYKGRPKKKVNEVEYLEIIEEYNKHRITAERASSKLGISLSTFFRRIRSNKI